MYEALSKIPFTKLGDRLFKAKIKKGIFDISPLEYKASGVPLVRVSNIVGSTFLRTGDAVFISEEMHARNKVTEFKEWDIVISKVGTVGECALLCGGFEKYNISQNVMGLSVENIDTKFLVVYLKSKYGKTQIERFINPQVQPKLNNENVLEIIIPRSLLSLSFQSRIASLIHEAYQKQKGADEKCKDAEELLYKSLEMWELKLSEEQTYLASNAEVEESGTSRLDAGFYQPKHLKISDILKTAPHLKDVALIPQDVIEPAGEPSRSFKYISLKNINGTNGEIEEIEEFLGWQAPSRARLQVKAKDILVSSLKGSLDKVGLVPEELDNSIASTGFFVVREKEEGLPAEVLFLLFRAPLLSLQLERISSGAILEAVPKGEFNKIKVAIPKNQKLIPVIASLVRESFALRKESRQRIEQAKREVEEYIEKEAENISTSSGEFAKG